jgi:hypothetical protein
MWWRRRSEKPAQPRAETRYREISSDRLEELARRGFARRHCFPHRVYYLPRCGSDGIYLAESMYGITDPSRLRQVLLFGIGEALEGIPPELFFDDDLVWHQQQLGLAGHVAAANLVLDGKRLLTTARFSDIVQRIGRRREHATRIEKRFRGWDHMLLNAILGYAIENRFEQIHFPTAAIAMVNVDKKRTVDAALFERVYDDDVCKRFDAVRRDDRWIVDVEANRDRWMPGTVRSDRLAADPAIVICHDTERELGHVGIDPEFVPIAAERSGESLRRMLDIEAGRGVQATYDVVGCLMSELRPAIEAGGHEVSFHSYDHKQHQNQLGMCREIDYRIKGYRAPQSKLTAELSDALLTRFNFEWLGSSHSSLGTTVPAMRGGVVRLPILFDDFPLYKQPMSYDRWEGELFDLIGDRSYAAFGLHDCYAHLWLSRFDGLLARLASVARLTTMGEVAASVALGCSE